MVFDLESLLGCVTVQAKLSQEYVPTESQVMGTSILQMNVFDFTTFQIGTRLYTYLAESRAILLPQYSCTYKIFSLPVLARCNHVE